MAWVFNDILRMRKLKAISDIARTSSSVLCARPTPTIEMASAIKPQVIGTRLSYLETSHPESGKPNNELMGIQRRIVPNSASFRSKAVFIVGIRDVHDVKQNPERKKNRLRNRRCRCLTSIRMKIRLRISTLDDNVVRLRRQK